MVRQHGNQKAIIIVVSIALLVNLMLALWFFPVGAQKQSGSWPFIQYDLGFIGIGPDLDIPLEQFGTKTYTILSNESELILLLQQLKSNCEFVYVDGEPVSNESLDWDNLFENVLSYNLFSDDHSVLAINVCEGSGGAVYFNAVIHSCYFRGNRAWVKVQTQEQAASTASYNGMVYLIPCPKAISNVRVLIDRNIEYAGT